MKLELDAAERFLADHMGGNVTPLEPLSGGDWSQAFAFRHNGQDLVARFGPFVEHFRKDRMAGETFSTDGLPIPRVLEIGLAFDGFFCLSERVFGEMIDGLDAGRMERIVPAVLRAHDAMREIDLSQWTAEAGAPSHGWANQLLSVDEENEHVFGWHDQIAASPTGIGPYREALAYLHAHIGACPDLDHLVHNDLLHANVLVAGDRITGIIDWGNFLRGDSLYDLAMFSFYAPWYPAMANIDWPTEALRHYRAVGLDVPDFHPRLRCYEVHLGLGGMAYNSFRRNWDQVERHAQRTLELLQAV